MKLNDEFNKIETTNGFANGGRNIFAGNFKPKEENNKSNSFKITEINKRKKTDTSKKTNKISMTLTSFLTVASAALLGVVGSDIIYPSSIEADVMLSAYETSVFYEVKLSEFNEEDDISVVIYNDFTNRVQKVTDSFFAGEEFDLKPNVKYNLEVRDGSKTIAKKSFTTSNRQEYLDDNFNNDIIQEEIIQEEIIQEEIIQEDIIQEDRIDPDGERDVNDNLDNNTGKTEETEQNDNQDSLVEGDNTNQSDEVIDQEDNNTNTEIDITQEESDPTGQTTSNQENQTNIDQQEDATSSGSESTFGDETDPTTYNGN